MLGGVGLAQAAVSYTHLDVYKRQVEIGSDSSAWADSSGKGLQSAPDLQDKTGQAEESC